MADHIYGRARILLNPNRPHMFIKELDLNIQYFLELLESGDEKSIPGAYKYGDKLLEGIAYYKNLADLIGENDHERLAFVSALTKREDELRAKISVREQIAP
jgi:hypothetical protein